MAHDCAQSKRARRSRGPKFDFDRRANGQVGDREQAHANLADVDSQRIHAANIGEHTNRGVEQLALLATPVLPGAEFEKHRVGNNKLAQHGGCAEITKGFGRGNSWDESPMHAPATIEIYLVADDGLGSTWTSNVRPATRK